MRSQRGDPMTHDLYRSTLNTVHSTRYTWVNEPQQHPLPRAHLMHVPCVGMFVHMFIKSFLNLNYFLTLLPNDFTNIQCANNIFHIFQTDARLKRGNRIWHIICASQSLDFYRSNIVRKMVHVHCGLPLKGVLSSQPYFINTKNLTSW